MIFYYYLTEKMSETALSYLYKATLICRKCQSQTDNFPLRTLFPFLLISDNMQQICHSPEESEIGISLFISVQIAAEAFDFPSAGLLEFFAAEVNSLDSLIRRHV